MLAALTELRILTVSHNSITTGVASLVTLTEATLIDFTANFGIPAAALDTLEAALGDAVVLRPNE